MNGWTESQIWGHRKTGNEERLREDLSGLNVMGNQ